MSRSRSNVAPGDDQADVGRAAQEIGAYLVGLVLAVALTTASFLAVRSHLIWPPAIPAALIVFAIAQMGVHLVFFLHITTGPESTNNVLALAFGILIVLLLIGGSVYIMNHLNQNMMPMSAIMKMQR